MQVFEKVSRRYEKKNRPVHQVVQYPTRWKARKSIFSTSLRSPAWRLARVAEPDTRSWFSISSRHPEMLALGTLDIGEMYNNFWINLRGIPAKGRQFDGSDSVHHRTLNQKITIRRTPGHWAFEVLLCDP
jgi:hypothetical protein